MGLSLTKTNDRTAESPEQDQTARMCSLILLYTLRKINLWSQKSGRKQICIYLSFSHPLIAVGDYKGLLRAGQIKIRLQEVYRLILNP